MFGATGHCPISETFQRLPDRPHVSVPAEQGSFSCHSSIFLVYSWRSFPTNPTLTDVALPGHKRQSGGGAAMTFEEIVDQAIAMLQRRGRVAYRTLKRQFTLDDDSASPWTRKAKYWPGRGALRYHQQPLI
jgi:hypothetical protein